jgi:hypothetical protein
MHDGCFGTVGRPAAARSRFRTGSRVIVGDRPAVGRCYSLVQGPVQRIEPSVFGLAALVVEGSEDASAVMAAAAYFGHGRSGNPGTTSGTEVTNSGGFSR